MSASEAQLIVDELFKANIQHDLDLRNKGADLWIRCPWHGGGREHTGSLRITIDEGNPHFGKCKCHGCGVYKHYNELADVFHLQKLDKDFKPVGNRPLSFVSKLEKKNRQIEDEIAHREFQHSTFEWPVDRVWRNIPGYIVVANGGVLTETRNALDEPRIAFPVRVWDETVGYIYAMIRDPKRNARGSKTEISYINSSGPWKEQVVYGFDEARKELRQKPYKALWLVEGPRDKHWLQTAGLIAVANMGSSFSKEKAELIKLLNPQRLLVASDADEAGDHLASDIFELLNGHVPLTKINWPKGKDPADMSLERLQYIDAKFNNLIIQIPHFSVDFGKSTVDKRKRKHYALSMDRESISSKESKHSVLHSRKPIRLKRFGSTF